MGLEEEAFPVRASMVQHLIPAGEVGVGVVDSAKMEHVLLT